VHILRLLTLPRLAGLAARGAAESAAKVTKDAAHYRDGPNNMQMCGMCKFYIPRGGQAGSGMMRGPIGPGMMGRQMGPRTPGVYTVHWYAVSADTHRTQGTFKFTVN
jgi:hypothetical protein